MGSGAGGTFVSFMALLDDRVARVRETIAEACRKVDRDPDAVRIVAVTKGHPAAVLRRALEAGLEDIGENRVQEALAKFGEAREAIERHRPRLHLIGHLQRNKVRDVLALFDWVQSVDSTRLARSLCDRAGNRPDPARSLCVLVQVNAARETRKHGFDPDEAVDRALEIAALPDLEVRGLMTMAPWTDDEAVLRRTFRTARRLFERIREQGAEGFDTLSMGMSNDFALAVEEGATMVRVGTVLFGPPN